MKPGNTYKLKVNRINEASYTVTDGKGTNIPMFFNDAKERYNEGAVVNAFLYVDSNKRICATDYPSLIEEYQGKFLEVVDFNPNVGFFLDMGIKKHLLLSTDNLPYQEFRPQVGDKVFVRLKTSPTGIFAKLVNKEDLEAYCDPQGKLEEGQKYKARVIKVGREGLNLLTEDFNHIFVYKLNTRKNHRVGEELEVKILKANGTDYNGTLIEQKENMISVDSETVLKVLTQGNGVINFDAKSDADEIYKRFKMSKRAFKNALGALYKERVVYFEDGKTILVNKEK